MIYEQTIKSLLKSVESRFRSKNHKSSIIIGILVFALGVLASYTISNSVSVSQRKDLDYAQNKQLEDVEKYINSKLDVYSGILIASGALFRFDSNVTAEDWSSLYTSLKLESRSPEILGMGFVEYAGTSTTNTTESARVKYIQPLSDLNIKALGYNMLSDPVRSAAIKSSQTTQSVTMSGPVLAVQDSARVDGRSPRSALLFYPVFNSESAQSNGKNGVLGYTYIIFRVEDILRMQKGSSSDTAERIKITDNTKDIITIVDPLTGSKDDRFFKELSIYARRWTVEINYPTVGSLQKILSVLYFIGGILLSFVLGSYIFMALSKRSVEMSSHHEVELQSTRNELLALASHQLRTPATGVRQYISMLSEGYFGDLTKEQKEVINKAYKANERQLETIDQLLYVAKAEAGQLRLKHSNFDIALLVGSIIEGLTEESSTKDIVPVYKGAMHIMCFADEGFVRMIVENLLSNAVKYSYARSKIVVKVSKKFNNVVLSVIDHGVGIDDKDKVHLFEKFNRIDNPLSGIESGSGLGLYLAKEIAKAHGGDIVVRSNKTKGVTFRLSLPIRPLPQNVVLLSENKVTKTDTSSIKG